MYIFVELSGGPGMVGQAITPHLWRDLLVYHATLSESMLARKLPGYNPPVSLRQQGTSTMLIGRGRWQVRTYSTARPCWRSDFLVALIR